MFYQRELSFLRDVFKKNYVETEVTEQYAPKNEPNVQNGFLYPQSIFLSVFPKLLPETLYKYTDPFARNYRFLLLPDTSAPLVLSIGPFLTSALTEQQLLEIGENNGISPQKHSHRYLSEYYAGLPTIHENSPLLIMLNAFCEKIWESPSFLVKDVTKNAPTDIPFSKTMLNIEPNETLVNKKAIEQRYSFENEMMRAVSLGQPHMENRFRAAFSESFFEQRASNPLRNAKNYGVIMNTLLRKAAEKGGVHPIHLDQTSSEFARKIERLSTLSAVAGLMSEMFRTYCRLVRRYSLRKFSLTVQKTMLIIDADLSADLSPKLLATSQGLSLGYLSTIFKKETGKTISEYIRERRMEYAEFLLNTTNLQIQTIALHCGIMDAQYFSKLFKKTLGKTPSLYRRLPQENN
ncbi:MAG: helix-turn-helix domain-containing protein [Clostridia bacterium]|nr:helix-turn-helix domain-containing protein [Clostridia bacterium]